MRILLLVVVVIGGVYAAVHFVPQDLKAQVSGTSIGQWITVTVPNYLREKLSIPENPIARRRELLDQLTSSLSQAKHDLEKVIPAGQSLPSASAVRSGVTKAEEVLNATQAKIEELKSTNVNESIFRKAALGVVDTIFPPKTPAAMQCVPAK